MKLLTHVFILAVTMTLTACSSSTEKKPCCATANDSCAKSSKPSDTAKVARTDESKATTPTDKEVVSSKKAERPIVYIYNFHVTNRCPSCVAIENATTKTLNTYFKKEMQQGRIIRKIVNVDEDANAKIAEKYEAFGSGLFITRSFKNQETTTDLTGDGFKFAKNKEDMFIDILKKRITNDLN